MNVEELRSSGYIIQEDPRYFTLRLNLPGGDLTLDQVEGIAHVAKKFGVSQVHLTTRQALQIPNIRFEDLDKATKELEEVNIKMGTCGPKYRNTTACPGWPECKNGTSTPRQKSRPGTKELADKLHSKYFGTEGPGKFKIGISGCPNACSRPMENDIGLVGVVEPSLKKDDCTSCGLCEFACKEGALELVDGFPQIDPDYCVNCGDCTRNCPSSALFAKREGFDIYFGARLARHPQLGKVLVRFASEDRIDEVVEKTIRFYQSVGEVGERFATVLNKFGLERFQKEILGEEGNE